MYDLSKIELNFLTETATRIPDVPDSDYFGPAYKDYISNSMLKLINPEEGGAPTRFLEGFSGTSSPALELGTAVHQMILEKEKHFLSEVEKPSGKVGLIIDTFYEIMATEDIEESKAIHAACIANDYYKASLTQKRIDEVLEKGREYYEYLKIKGDSPGSIVLTPLMREKLYGCLESAKNNKLITDLLLPSGEDELGLSPNIDTYNEDVMTMDFEALIPAEDDIEDIDSVDVIELRIKAKIDNWTIDFDNKVLTLNDLKTTGKPLNTFAGIIYKATNAKGEDYEVFKKGSFQDYHYYRQMAMYAFILKSYAVNAYGIDDTWKLRVNMLVVETNKPHMSHVFSVGNKWLKIGYYEFLNLLKRVAYHKLRGFDKFIEMDFNNITEIE